VDLLALTAKAADLFLKQAGAEQSKFLRLVLESASWKGGELRMSLREPFSQIRLSNRESQTKNSHLSLADSSFDIWR
jgi:hypothetical protein